MSLNHVNGDNEPEMVKALSAGFANQAGPERELSVAFKIYTEFKWACKKADQTYNTLAALLDQCIADAETKMKPGPIRAKAIEKFTQMKNRVSEFTVEHGDEMAKLCEKCGLALFICPCPKV